MTTKNKLGGALINYGDTLPAASTSPDGALFFKTSGVDRGLYIYRLLADTTPLSIGNQAGAGWDLLISTATGGGVDADTLNGLPASAFQPVNSELTGLSSLSSTGIVVRTGAGTFAGKSIEASSLSMSGSTRLFVSNGTGTGAGNIQLDVNEANLTLDSIGGTLSLSKGGTGTGTALGVNGGVVYSVGSSLAALVGSSGQVLLSGGAGAPSWVNQSTLSVGTATNANFATTAGSANTATLAGSALTANSATTAGSANTAAQLLNGRNFDITGPAATPGLLTTEAAVVFDGTQSVTLRINSVDAGLLAGVVPSARISGNYTGFANIQGTGNCTFNEIVGSTFTLPTPTGIIRRNDDTGTIELRGGFTSNTGASITVSGQSGTGANTGRLRVGTTALLEWSGAGIFMAGSVNISGGNLFVDGSITATGNVTAFAPSDVRLKKDVEVIGAAVDTVKKLRGVSYTMKSSGRREVGLIAQELQQVVPQVVREGSDGYLGVQYGHLVGLLVEAIKEQQEQIDGLKYEVETLRR